MEDNDILKRLNRLENYLVVQKTAIDSLSNDNKELKKHIKMLKAKLGDASLNDRI